MLKCSERSFECVGRTHPNAAGLLSPAAAHVIYSQTHLKMKGTKSNEKIIYIRKEKGMKMSKSPYEEANCLIVYFGTDDVISTSSPYGEEDTGDWTPKHT